ncbi:hypothetical protein BAE44_0020718, partial [Dichanthelium oligosanthes]
LQRVLREQKARLCIIR